MPDLEISPSAEREQRGNGFGIYEEERIGLSRRCRLA